MTHSTKPITEALVDQLRARAAAGLEKYGTTLDRQDIDLEGWLQHMLEELLDGAGYAMAAMRKARGLTVALSGLIEAVDSTVEIPEPDCRCHASPPCRDCVEWSGLREALANAKAAIAMPKPHDWLAHLAAPKSQVDAAPANAHQAECWCLTCRPITDTDMRFVVCSTCGNKRCPRANDHRNACTGSNATGQPGSAWEHVKPAACPRCSARTTLACAALSCPNRGRTE